MLKRHAFRDDPAIAVDLGERLAPYGNAVARGDWPHEPIARPARARIELPRLQPPHAGGCEADWGELVGVLRTNPGGGRRRGLSRDTLVFCVVLAVLVVKNVYFVGTIQS